MTDSKTSFECICGIISADQKDILCCCCESCTVQIPGRMCSTEAGSYQASSSGFIQHYNQLLNLLFFRNAILLLPSTQIVDHAKGKDAQTHVERVDHTDDLADNSISDVRVLSYVKLMPLTGR